MKKLYAILFISLPILQSFAQQYTVTGKVSRISDNKGLRGAHVYIKNNENTEISTDAEGLYQIIVNKGDTLIIWGAGYKTQEIVVKKKKHNIKLEKDEGFSELLADLSRLINRMESERKEVALIYMEGWRWRRCPPCTEEDKRKQDSIKALEKKKIIVRGNVTLKGSDIPKQVEVVLTSEPWWLREYSYTGQYGNYQINANIGDKLVFSRFGYHPVEIEVTGDKHDILLIPDEKKYELDELQEIIDDMNKHIDLIRRENNNHYRPLPCPECPPTEKTSNIK